MVYDVIIIGGGPAGITAAVYAVRKRVSALMLTGDIGGQTIWSGQIENYTGYQLITGPELAQKFEEHMRTFDIDVHEGELVQALAKDGTLCRVTTTKGTYEGKTVIVASGKQSRELGVPGEKEFKNRGLTYCATCDGPLFSGKDVAVIGGGNSALDAAIQMVRIARQVTVVNINDAFTGDSCMVEELSRAKNLRLLHGTRVTGIAGDTRVRSMTLARAGHEETLPVEGVFVEIGLIPNTQFAGILARNDWGEIKVNCRNETSVPGIFAAGDVTDVPEKQIIIAAGEGSKAALSAFRYLMQHKY